MKVLRVAGKWKRQPGILYKLRLRLGNEFSTGLHWIFGETLLRPAKLLSTFAGDIIPIQDLVVGTAAGPAVRDGQAQAAAAAVVNPAGVGAWTKKGKPGNKRITRVFPSPEGADVWEADQPCCW